VKELLSTTRNLHHLLILLCFALLPVAARIDEKGHLELAQRELVLLGDYSSESLRDAFTGRRSLLNGLTKRNMDNSLADCLCAARSHIYVDKVEQLFVAGRHTKYRHACMADMPLLVASRNSPFRLVRLAEAVWLPTHSN
jgi:hypothetical protein